MAATLGNAEVLQHMVRQFCEQQKLYQGSSRDLLLRALRMPDPDKSSGMTALQYASSAERGSLETLRELLKYPGIVGPSDNPDPKFQRALEDGKVAIVEEFLKHEELREVLIKPESIMKAMTLQHESESFEHEDRTKIVRRLLEHTSTPQVFNSQVVQKIVELGLMDFWTKRPQDVPLDESHLLHLAVYHQKLEFVKLFARDYPGTVAVKALVPGTGRDDGDQGHYPLWYNNKIWKDSGWMDRPEDQPASTDIRTAVVTATIRGTAKMQALLDILRESGETVHELCFDMSKFDSKLYRVRDFVRSLIRHRENEGLLVYEPTIKYARFPALDIHGDDKETFGKLAREEHTEVFDTLDWLGRAKKVSSIIELKVPDRLLSPHNELEIAKYVRRFGVEILDWRFLDMSLSIFHDEKVKPYIRGLHLYSSGKRAVISHWLSDEGIKSFPNLSWIRVHVIQEMMAQKYCKNTCKYIREKLGRLRKEWSGKEKRRDNGPDMAVNAQLWNPTHERIADSGEISQRAFPDLSPFILSYRTYGGGILQAQNAKTVSPTKVAIIDSGILSIAPVPAGKSTSIGIAKRVAKPGDQAGSMRKRAGDASAQGQAKKSGARGALKALDSSTNRQVGTIETDDDDDEDDEDDEDKDDEDEDDDNNYLDLGGKSKSHRTLWPRIRDGCSFFDDDFQASPWLFASDPHGTQMANLICGMDPLCELYIAKVTEGDRYGITPFRVSKAIDWAGKMKVDIISMCFSMLDELNASISRAHADGIIMMCSSHDKGANVPGAWPADAVETITVTACDEYGSLPRQLNDEKYAFKLPGLNIAAGVVPFLESSDRISGNSVATAIASGLSSLILSCARLTNPTEPIQGSLRRFLVMKYLRDMQSSSASKYLLLEKFGNIDTKVNQGETISAEAIMRKTFDSRQWKTHLD